MQSRHKDENDDGEEAEHEGKGEGEARERASERASERERAWRGRVGRQLSMAIVPLLTAPLAIAMVMAEHGDDGKAPARRVDDCGRALHADRTPLR